MKKNGLFIVFEGPEGSGKSTQAKLLCKYLKNKNYDVVLTREPGGTKVAEMIREILLHKNIKISPLTELLLYESARAQHIQEIIKPALLKGKIVISDRFSDASLVYQGYARGLGMKFVKKINDIVVSDTYPDITFILDVNPDEGLVRIKNRTKKFDRLENENIEFHKKIRQGYLNLAKNKKKFYLISTQGKCPKEVHKEIIKVLNKKFGL
ncbi:MAG: dTMP kinase [Endomicrobiia bacterium]